MLAEKDDNVSIVTLDVLKRKFNNIFGISLENGQLSFRNNLFSNTSGSTTIKNVVEYFGKGKNCYFRYIKTWR